MEGREVPLKPVSTEGKSSRQAAFIHSCLNLSIYFIRIGKSKLTKSEESFAFTIFSPIGVLRWKYQTVQVIYFQNIFLSTILLFSISE